MDPKSFLMAIVFMIAIYIVAMCGVILCAVYFKYKAAIVIGKEASKAAREIAAEGSSKIRRKIIEDIDTGNFEREDGWIRSSKE